MVWKKVVESSVKLKRMLGHRGQDAGTRGRNRQMFPNTRSLAEGTVQLGPKLQRRGWFWTLVPPEFLGELSSDTGSCMQVSEKGVLSSG